MQQIANEVGISRAGVSAILNGRDIRMSEKTKEKVLKLADKYNYRPNTAARMLHGKPGKIIGMLNRWFQLCIFSEISNRISQQLIDRGYNLYYSAPLAKSNTTVKANEIKEVNSLVADGASAFIVVRNNTHFTHADFPKPMVMVSNIHPEYDLRIDLEAGGRQVGEHFYEQGARRWAFLQPVEKGVDLSGNDKFAGLVAAAAAHGLQKPLLVDIHSSSCSSDMALFALLDRHRIDACFCCNDLLAAHFCRQAMNRNWRSIPGDMLVCGCDGFSFCDFYRPRLTTLVQAVNTVTSHTLDLLDEKLKTNQMARHPSPRVVIPELHKSESTGCYPDEDSITSGVRNYNKLTLECRG